MSENTVVIEQDAQPRHSFGTFPTRERAEVACGNLQSQGRAVRLVRHTADQW